MPEENRLHARAIGEKLRAVRRQRGMSLRVLADRAAVSRSMLSQIETGKAYPSVRSMYNIADALAVPVDYFFPDQGRHNPTPFASDSAIADDTAAHETLEARVDQAAEVATPEFYPRELPATPIVRAGARPSIQLKGGITWSRLTAHAESGAEFLEIDYAPGASSGARMSHHQGREFGLVLEGELTVELGFEAYRLRPGDSIVFDSATPHRLSNNSPQPMRALWVVFDRG